MWLAKASSISAKFEILTCKNCKNYASYVNCQISLPCSINRKQHGFFGVFGINTSSWYFKTPQISVAATAARDILVNCEISLAVFIPNTPRNRAISYTNYWPIGGTHFCWGHPNFTIEHSYLGHVMRKGPGRHEKWFRVICIWNHLLRMAAVIGFSFKGRFLRFHFLFPDFYHFHHVIWRMKWAKTLQTRNGQNMSSGPFSHDAAHLVISEHTRTSVNSEHLETVKAISRCLKPVMKNEARFFNIILITSMQRTLITLPFKPVSPNEVAFCRTLKRNNKTIEGASVDHRDAWSTCTTNDHWDVINPLRQNSIVSEIIVQIPDLHNRQKSGQNI